MKLRVVRSHISDLIIKSEFSLKETLYGQVLDYEINI